MVYYPKAGTPAAVPGTTNLLAVLYEYPNPATDWNTLNSTAPPVRYVVANVSSGPGSSADAHWTAAINAANAAGITVLGYVDTNYGAVASATAQANMALWTSLYGVTSYFFDRADTTAANLNYYTLLATQTHGTPGAIAVLNHGAVPIQAYASIGDILVIFENQYSAWPVTMPAWSIDYPPGKFAIIMYNCSSGNLASVMSTAQGDGIGNVWITDAADALYDELPTYLATEAGLALSLGAGLVTIAGTQTLTGQKTFTATGSGSAGALISNDITVMPNSGVSGSASMFLNNGAGQVWEFFCNPAGNFGAYDKTGNSATPFYCVPGAGGAMNLTPLGSIVLNPGGGITASALVTLDAGTTTAPSAPILTGVAGTNGGGAVQLSDHTRDYIVYLQVGTAGTAFIVSMGHTSSGNDVTLHASGTATAGQVLSFRLPAGWYFLWSATTATLAQSVAVGC
jgi:Spherulation-specific family 4